MSDESKLDEIAVSQLMWKNPVCQKLAVRICQTACSCDGVFYPDSIRHDDIADADVNVIGTMFRTLAGRKCGKIIARTGSFRKSTAKGANSRTIFAYVLTSRALAESLVRRYGASVQNPQTEMQL